MSQVRIIQCNAGNDTLVWKYPFPKIVRGSVISVHPNQVACIYANGVRMYTLEPDRNVVVDSAQMPDLDNVLYVAAGGQQIYSFEVWYANMTCEQNIGWSINGEADGVSIMDSSIGAPLKLNANGRYRCKICDAGLLLDKLVGAPTQFAATQVLGFLSTQIKCLIIDVIMTVSKERQMTIQQILTQRQEFNATLQLALNEESKHLYGLEITDFSIAQLSSCDYDASIGHKRTGPGNAAQQPVMGDATPPPFEEASIWHYAMDGKPSSPMSATKIKELISQNVISGDTKLWKPGMASWMSANQIPEFANLFIPPLE